VSEPIRKVSTIKVLSLPRTRRLAVASVLVECSSQLFLALWVGALAATSLLAWPSLFHALDDPFQAARAALELEGRIAFLGAGAGAFLLLSTLLMHLLALRGTRATLLQTGFLLAMTFASIGVYLGLVPPMQDLLQETPGLFSDPAAGAELARFERLRQITTGIVASQLALGATLLMTGVRRWYRYVPTGVQKLPTDAS